MDSDYARSEGLLAVYFFYKMYKDCHRKNSNYLAFYEFYLSHHHRLSAVTFSCKMAANHYFNLCIFVK
jgi:hypothetical protein